MGPEREDEYWDCAWDFEDEPWPESQVRYENDSRYVAGLYEDMEV